MSIPSKICFAIAALLFFLNAIAADFLPLDERRSDWGWTAISLGLLLSDVVWARVIRRQRT